ncbi:MAG: PQQ-binding-like beta-propeller repeat protein, partial [Chloroflexota bacterium]
MRRTIFLCVVSLFSLALIGAGRPPTDLFEPNGSAPSLTSGLSDWTRTHFDPQRSNYNILETELEGTFSSLPSGFVSYEGTDNVFVAPSSVVVDDTIFWRDVTFSTDSDGFLLAATDFAGNELWRVDVPANAAFSRTSAPEVVGNTVLVMEDITDGTTFESETALVARSISTGAELWRQPGGTASINTNESNPTMVADDTHVYVGWLDSSNDGQISKLDIATGATVWQIEPDNNGSDEVEFMALTDPSTGLNMLVVTHFSNMVAYDTVTGAELWENDLGEINADLSVFTDPQDLILQGDLGFAVNNAKLAAVDLDTGATEWQKVYRGDDTCESSNDAGFASNGNTLFLSGECDRDLVAYELQTGTEVWRQSILRGGGYNRAIGVSHRFVYSEGFDDSIGSFG